MDKRLQPETDSTAGQEHKHGHAHAHGDGHQHAGGCCAADEAGPVATDEAEVGDGYRRFRISGMDCASCANTISTAVGGMPGVRDVRVSVPREMMFIAIDEARTPLDRVGERVKSLGYGAELLAADAPAPRPVAVAWWRTPKGLHAIVGGIATAAAFVINHIWPVAGHYLFIAAAILLALPSARRAVAAALAGAPFTIEMLMTVAVISISMVKGAPASAAATARRAMGSARRTAAAMNR